MYFDRFMPRAPSCAPVLLLVSLSAQAEWRQLPWPDARIYHAAAYDVRRGGTVVFGGIDDFYKNDTWHWDGQAWSQSSTTTRPSARYGASAVYDLARSRVLLFGGWNGSSYLNDTWVYDGQAWYELMPGVRPGGRHFPGLAWDARRGVAVLYGGERGGNWADTWEWNGNVWQERAQTSPPGGRYSPAMTYDPAIQATLMFGGNRGGALQDTWSWDGTTWAQQSPTAQPSPRYHSAMVDDPLRRQVVLYGGYTGSSSLGDTWVWDGGSRSWTQRTVSGPGARHGHSMVFDARRGKAVLVGGERNPAPGVSLSDVWEWDGSAWTKAHDTVPTGRWACRMAYEPSTDQVMLFGGAVNTTNSVPLGDTWLWNGTTWREAPVTTSPPARAYHGLAHDPVRRRTVLFGGWNPNNLGDTWEWNGLAWQQLQPVAPRPSARHAHAMTFHAGINKVVLFGGYTGAANNETWTFDGTTWTNRTVVINPPTPPGRWNHAIAYDPMLDRVVLFGGTNEGGGFYGDTWSWTDTAGWVQCNCGGTTPPARQAHSMAYDESRQAVVLFSGSNNGYFSDTWELRGSTWSRCTQLQEPPARNYQAMTYDSRRQRLLAFGGYLRGSDFWECVNPNPATFTPVAGTTGCPIGGNTPTITADNLPWRGEDFRVAMAPLPTGTLVSPLLLVGFPPAVTLPVFPFPPCQLHVYPIVLQIPMTGTTPGRAVGSLPIPHDWTWLGAQLVTQCVALQAFPLQMGMTPAAIGVVGARHP